MGEIVKVCPCCQRQLTAPQWAALPSKGEILSDDDVATYRLELRNCPCGSTIGIEHATPKEKR